MRRLFQLLIISCALTGCIINRNVELNYIINENVATYHNNSEIEFTNVAAIFKSYASLINSKKYDNLNALKADSENFFKELENNTISSNYPIKAKKSEVQLVKDFIKDLIHFLHDKKIKPENYQNYINNASNTYISEIVYHEQIY